MLFWPCAKQLPGIFGIFLGPCFVVVVEKLSILGLLLISKSVVHMGAPIAWHGTLRGRVQTLAENLKSRTSPHIVGKSNFGMAQRNAPSESTSSKAISFRKKDVLEPKLS